VVVTSDFPRTIVIDEPSSFLHVGAAKKLIQILKRFSQHQYVISTHTADLIETINPDKLFLVKWRAAGSEVIEIDRQDRTHLRLILSEVGSSLSDLFGSDAIIWVEGQTEEKAFLVLLGAAGIDLPIGINIAHLHATGDFTGKHKKAFFSLYERLSNSSKNLPTALVYSLDSEGLNDLEKQDLIRELKNRIRFLPRRSFENFLLNPGAISALLKRLGENIQPSDVEKWLVENGGKNRYYQNRWNHDLLNEEWLRDTDAPKLLKALFSQLTDTRFTYSKVEYGFQLITWVIDNESASLRQLIEYVVGLATGE